MTGPSLTKKLVDVLVRFRKGQFVYTADIVKAFLQVRLKEVDRDYTRFLWVKDMEAQPVKFEVFRFRSVLFGSTSSPFLLQATFTKHLSESENPLGAKILEQFYVDNFQGTCDTREELFNIFHNANSELAKARMPLQSWNSNNKELRKIIDKWFPGEVRPINTLVLGLNWNVERDELSIKSVKFSEQVLSKRSLLSQVSSVFDPLGLISPLVIRGKMLIQRSWSEKLGWDDPLPEDLCGRMARISGKISRC